jgi:hypothetical protein
MIGDRIADALAEAAMDASGRAPVLLDGQQGDTYERLRDDLKAAVKRNHSYVAGRSRCCRRGLDRW